MISLLLLALLAQTPTPTGSIRGTVKDSGTGSPIPDVQVRIIPGGRTVQTDSAGAYEFKELAPRTYRLNAAKSFDGHPGFGAFANRAVQLAAGQQVTGIDITLREFGEIAGRVLDDDGEPIPDITVFLVTREYQFGALRYVFTGRAVTDDQGAYRLKRITPGRGYTVTAQKREMKLPAVADTPADPKLRKRTWVPAYYPGAPSVEGAQYLFLSPGEKREGIDLRLTRAPNFCLEARLETMSGPAALDFGLELVRPASGRAGDGGFYTSSPGGKTGPDGKLRICNLFPGDFHLLAWQLPGFFSMAPFSITDSDVPNLRLAVRPKLPLSGEIVFYPAPPEAPVTRKAVVNLDPTNRPNWMSEERSVETSIPGPFRLSAIFAGEYRLDAFRLPEDTYIKDITYGGASILYDTLRVGSAAGDATLRFTLGRDGGRISAKVADKDGHPQPGTWVALIPAGATTEAEIADRMITGQTDQDGVYASKPLAPGKYYLLASATELTKTPETTNKLATTRTAATEVDLAPNATQSVTIQPKLE